MSLCESIETLSMAYLDDELAAEERHELEAHVSECASCKAHLDGERVDLSLVRRAIAAPPAPDVMLARISRALDLEDKQAVRAERRRISQWLLPGSAVLAAAAAIAVFVGVRPPTDHIGTAARVAVSTQQRTLPLEVQGENTGPWLRANFSPQMEPPQISEPGTKLIGARLLPLAVNGHDGALLSYEVNLTGQPFLMSVLVVRDVKDDEMNDGDEVRVGNRTLHVVRSEGRTFVTWVDPNRMGYMFIADQLSVNELVWLVGRTNIGR